MRSMSISKLDAGSRPKQTYHYEVEGKGAFPYDMLRYDAAWPAREEDAARIERCSLGRLGGQPALVKIQITSFYAPTPERWASFGWVVL